MKITLNVADVKVDVNGITEKAKGDPAFWTFAAMEWHTLYTPYVPMQTGVLTNTVSFSPGEIEHTVIYANYQYTGFTFKYSHDLHPKASAKWDQAAAPTQLPKLAKAMQAYIDQGRLKLD